MSHIRLSIPMLRLIIVRLGAAHSLSSPADAQTSAKFLVGDANITQALNLRDMSSVKARSVQTATTANFMHDLAASGAINAGDIAAVKVRLNTVLSP